MTREDFIQIVKFMGSMTPQDIANKEIGNLAIKKEVVSTDVVDAASFFYERDSISPVVGERREYKKEDEIELPFNCIPRDVVYGERVEVPEFRYIKSYR